ncbi:phenylalanine--tRNA ligase beta subunit-related protein [Streptomyces sp. MMG1121]|uniref:phenylalanine--tRNA ligase beta subunit-related protein n=1 Tax=Streptomyces sp. MMG1121 TaxID=1415544 RepID=UPI001F1C39D9|nr:phenylalanine--tRNA ligase beta subunit-related protein [Streptomyces sp. MMG1121]
MADLCNALSAARAVPAAALDADRVLGPLPQVRPAAGDGTCTAFGGGVEHPAPVEATFADSAGRAHARRWPHRQSGRSAVGEHTRRVLVAARAVHDGGPAAAGPLSAGGG